MSTNWNNPFNFNTNTNTQQPFNFNTNTNTQLPFNFNTNTQLPFNFNTNTNMQPIDFSTAWNKPAFPAFQPNTNNNLFANFNNNNNVAQPDILTIYKQASYGFTEQFYKIYDNNYNMLQEFITDKTFVTFHDYECIGAAKFSEHIRNKGITSFKHQNYKIVSQPVGKNSIILAITGELFITSNQINTTKHMFTDTLLLTRDKNVFHVGNYIFNAT